MNKPSPGTGEARLFCRLSLMLAATIFLAAGHSFAATDLDNVEINGFRLGMKIDEVKKIHPDMVVKEIRPEGGILIGFKANIGNVALSFTTAELGYSLFYIQKVRLYPSKQDSYQIFSRFLKKYGKPDYSGRQMFHIHACWGRCYGQTRRLEFRMKISGVANRPFPMTLTLSDPTIEQKNRRLFAQKLKAGK